MASNFHPDTKSESISEPNSKETQSCNEDRNWSNEGPDYRGKKVETKEALKHLPEELRDLLMEYRMTNMDMKDENRYLKPLAEFYQREYDAQPDLWMSGLRTTVTDSDSFATFWCVAANCDSTEHLYGWRERKIMRTKWTNFCTAEDIGNSPEETIKRSSAQVLFGKDYLVPPDELQPEKQPRKRKNM